MSVTKTQYWYWLVDSDDCQLHVGRLADAFFPILFVGT